MLQKIIAGYFWRMYFKVYDRNKSLPYLRLISQGAELVVNNRAGKYLDLGCGTGNSTAEIAKRLVPGGRVIGIDNSREALIRARRKYPDIEFIFGDINQRFPFANESFDGVLANNVIYLVSDPQKTLLEVLRVLRPGGVFLMSNPKEASSSQAIFEEHLAEKKALFTRTYGKYLGKVAFAGHVLWGLYNYFLILPFELILKHSFKIESRFWPVESWLEELNQLKETSPYPFAIKPHFMSYAGQNHTIILERLHW